MPKEKEKHRSRSRSRSPRPSRRHDDDAYDRRRDDLDRSYRPGARAADLHDDKTRLRVKSRSPRRRSPSSYKRRSRSRSPAEYRRKRGRSQSRSRSHSPGRSKRERLRSGSRGRAARASRSRSRSRSGSRGHKGKRSRSRSVSSSFDDDSDSRSRKRKSKRKERERRRSRSRERKKEKKKDRKDKKKKKSVSGASHWGKYGIISESDIFKKDSEFSAWLVEERKINPETISKDQRKKEFAKFVEDFNTATLPHEKYYSMVTYDRRMAALRQGEFIPPSDDVYDPDADLKAIKSAHKKKVDHQSYLSREQLLELRKVQKERVEVGKMKLLGMDIKQNMGVRMDGSTFDD